MNKYDEVSSLTDALRELGICKTSQAVIRTKLVREACNALGITAISTMEYPTDCTKYSATEKGDIVKWLAAKYAEPILLYEEPIPLKKPRQYADKYKYKTIAFNTDKNTRHVIKLEAYYTDALKKMGIENIPVFLANVTSDEWNATTEDKSIAKIVKCAIITKLMTKW